MTRHPTEESFLKDVAEHQLTVLQDEGIYRHIRLKKPDSGNMWFDLITGPGYLHYRGDMGAYTFERIPDMFEFFRTDQKYATRAGRSLTVNKGYWAEKCHSQSIFGNGVKEFSHEYFEETVRYQVSQYLEEKTEPFTDEDLAEFNDEIGELISSVETGQDAYLAVTTWEHPTLAIKAVDVFGQDAWEYDFREYTYHFVWCCYAITWGIQQYDLLKLEESI